MQLPQQTAPYLDALTAYAFREPTRFHVPGHKGGPGADPGLRRALGEGALALDVAQGIGDLDMGSPPTPYDHAEALAADLYGAERTWFLTNGATQGNHALCLALAPEGAQVVVQRNSHGSLVDGLVLSGGVPHWIAPEYDDDLGMAHGVTPAALQAGFEATPGARAAFIVSPTYYGMAADVAGCAAVAQAAGAALIVDQAWGPHFGFHPGVPASALAQGADAMITSTHKIVGSLTQSAMLHVARDGRVDPARVARMVRLLRSTSPNSLLLASLDAARRQLAIHGQDLLAGTIAAAAREVASIEAIPGCTVVGEDLVGRPGVAAWDPLRIVVDVRGTGCTGFEVAEALQRSSDVYVELATHATIVLLLGVGQPTGPLKRFAHDLAAELEDIRRPGVAPALAQPQTALRSEAVLSPRAAFLGETRVLAVDEAVGGVSAESIAGYPPGIPALLPGERITAEVVAYLRALSAAGARLHGASDPAFETINVCAQVPVGDLAKLVAGALAEDIGTGDVTARATVPESARARAQIAQKQPGVIYGIDAAAEAFRQLDPDAAIETPASEGEWREQGPVLAVEGNARALLAAERTALNLLAHLSGVATLTARCVGAVRGTGATILDTRKTTPGLRALEKAAVRAGGGFNHRAGLHDAVLIKENHVALAGGVGEAVRRALEGAPGLPVEVECRTPAEIGEALAAGAPRILLDNTSLEQLREAVAQVDGRAELEASGGITLESLKAHASTGVQFISIGALTHSAPSLDLSMTLEALR